MAQRQRIIFPDPSTPENTFLGDLFRRESVGGTIALVAATVAVIWANTPFSPAYDALRAFDLGPLDLEHWAADGALALFFFVAGLELKREFVCGSLRNPADAAVPIVAAVCGVALPAAVFLAVNSGAGGEPGGWAIPAATDIAFALAVLAVVGSNLPTALRAFLLTLAVVDDLIVVTIIAIFFTDDLALTPLLLAVLAHGRVGGPAAGPGQLARSSTSRSPWSRGGASTRVASTPPSPAWRSAC